MPTSFFLTKKSNLQMKKLFFLFAFLSVASFTVTAQTTKAACTKSKTECSKSKAAATSTEATLKSQTVNEAAVKLASLDENIEQKTCAETGTVSFTRKDVCAKSGTVSYTDVEYCSKSAKFVNVSPSEKAACCASKADASASTVKGAATTKACCAGKKNASCSGATKTAAQMPEDAKKTEKAVKAKLIKN